MTRATLTGETPEALRDWCERNGWTITKLVTVNRGRPVIPVATATLRVMRAEGMGYQAIGERVGMDESTVRYRLKKDEKQKEKP